ncbi:MAG: hypothetical protein ROR55_03405 [Devosia sp.]
MSDAASILPQFVTPDDFAAHYGFSAREVRRRARAIGACCIIGKRMVLLPHHCDLLIEDARPCRSRSTVAAKSGTTAVPSPEGDFEALRAQRTKRSRKGSRQKRKPENGVVISMAQVPK